MSKENQILMTMDWQDKEITSLRSRLAEVEKAHESALAKLGNELFKLREERDTYKAIAEEAVKIVRQDK